MLGPWLFLLLLIIIVLPETVAFQLRAVFEHTNRSRTTLLADAEAATAATPHYFTAYTNSTPVSSATVTMLDDVERDDDKYKLLLFCKFCSFAKKKEVKQFMNQSIKERYAITRIGDKLYNLTNSPALVLASDQFTSRYDKKWPDEWSAQEVNEWLRTSKIDAVMAPYDRRVINMTFFNEILDGSKEETVWLIVITTKEKNKYRGQINNILQRVDKGFQESVPAIEVARIIVDEDDSVILKYRLSVEDVYQVPCPVVLIVYQNMFENVDYDCQRVHFEHRLVEQVLDRLRASYITKRPQYMDTLVKIKQEKRRERRQKIKDQPSELLLLYESLNRKSEDKRSSKTFWAIGVSGGVAVVALAISIFWGLKSSS